MSFLSVVNKQKARVAFIAMILSMQFVVRGFSHFSGFPVNNDGARPQESLIELVKSFVKHDVGDVRVDFEDENFNCEEAYVDIIHNNKSIEIETKLFRVFDTAGAIVFGLGSKLFCRYGKQVLAKSSRYCAYVLLAPLVSNIVLDVQRSALNVPSVEFERKELLKELARRKPLMKY